MRPYSVTRTHWYEKIFRWFRPLDVLFLLFAGGFFVAALRSVGAWQNILSSITASFLFVYLIDQLAVVQRHIEFRKFRQFFGEEAAKNQMYFVYPEFVLSDRAEKAM